MILNQIKTKVWIVGGGPVGMTVSLLLKKFGIESVIIEKDSGNKAKYIMHAYYM